MTVKGLVAVLLMILTSSSLFYILISR